MAAAPRDRFVGIDVGTSTVSAVLWDAAARRPVATVTLGNDAALPIRAPLAEQDPMRILGVVRRAIDEVAAATPGPVAGVACTGQMHGVLLADDRFEPVTPLVTWQDRRAEAAAGEMNATLDRLDPLGPVRRGCRLHPGYGGATLAWMVREGALPARARRACTIADWVAARLCGVLATDPSHAASWGLLDLERGDWDRAALAALGIPERIVPPVREAGSALGVGDLGPLGRAVPVKCCIGDNQASVLAAAFGLPTEECCVVNVGTGSQISVIGAGGARGAEGAGPALERRPFVGGAMLHVGASLNGGAAYALVRKLLAGALEQPGATGDDLYALMELWARAVPAGCDGLVCDPAFYGERGREELTGSLRGITARNLTPGHLARAVLEGMARSLHDIYRSIGIPKRRLVASGNAVRKNALFREILAERFDLPLFVSPFMEEAAVGAAMVAAGVSAGEATA